MACVLVAAALILPAPLGGNVLSARDMTQFAAPFAGERPADLDGPSNAALADAVYIFNPELELARSLIRGGELPMWDPYAGAGRPLIAVQQFAPFYPLNTLAYLLPFQDSLALILMLKLVTAAAGMLLFCRRLGLGWSGSLIGALAFAFGSGFVIAAEHPHTSVYAFLPWMMLFTDRLLTADRRRRDAFLLALVTGMALLGGHPESMLITLATVAAFAGFRLWEARKRAIPWRRASLLVGALALGGGVGAVMVLPLLELVANAYDVSRTGAPFAPRGLATGFALPEYWGRPDKVTYPGGVGSFADRTFYIGVLPLLLALGATLADRRRPARFFALLAAAALLVALDSPGLGGLLRDVPGLATVNISYAIWAAVFSLAVLAAHGADLLATGSARRRRHALAAAGAAATIPLVVLATLTPSPATVADALAQLPAISAERQPAVVAQTASVLRWGVLAMLGLGIAALAHRRPRLAPWAVAGLAALTAADLAALNRAYHPVADRARAAPRDGPAIDFLQREADGSRMAGVGETLGPNLADRYGLRDMRVHQLPRLERYHRLYLGLGGDSGRIGTHRTLYEPDGRDANARLLTAFAVRYVLAGREWKPAAGLVPRFEGAGTRIFLNRGAPPRAWLAHRWRPAPGQDEALAAVRRSSPAELVTAPVVEGASRPRAVGRRGASTARISLDEPDRLTVEVASAAPGYLVLADTFYPGWEAEVDGTDAEIRPANAAFRAVAVPAGRHRVTFRYRPWTVTVGVILSLGSLLTVGLGLAWTARRRA